MPNRRDSEEKITDRENIQSGDEVLSSAPEADEVVLQLIPQRRGVVSARDFAAGALESADLREGPDEQDEKARKARVAAAEADAAERKEAAKAAKKAEKSDK